MNLLLYTVVGLSLLVFLTALFNRPLLTALGKWIAAKKVSKTLESTGLTIRNLQLNNGIKAWYLERGSNGPADGPPLIVLPGATLSMTLMGIRLEGLLEAIPKRRVIVMELPYHGRNVSLDLDFTKQANSITAIAAYLEQLRTALNIEEPFDLMGYSLGGGVATHYAVDYPQNVHRLLLLAPYFYETSTAVFNGKFDNHKWRDIHGWESFEEMKNFFHHWLGLSPDDAPPQFVMRGIHALRSEAYPKGYWSAFFAAVEEPNKASNTFLTDRKNDLANFQRPTLLITGNADVVCDAQKLAGLKDIFGVDVCTVDIVPCHHFFGKNGATLCEIGKSAMVKFLST